RRAAARGRARAFPPERVLVSPPRVPVGDGARLEKGAGMDVRQQRRSMLAGMAFVALFLAGVFVTFANTPNIKSSDTAATVARKWVSELSSSGPRVGMLVGAYLLIIAAIAFVWFCSGLREWLAADGASGRAISSLRVLGAGAIAVGAMTGGAGTAGAIEFGEFPVPQNGDAIWAVSDVSYPLLFVVFGLVSAALIATIAASAGEAVPRWIVFAGVIAVFGSIAGVFFIPF